MDSTPPSRRPWLAVLLSLLCNGLGHVYAGRAAAGLAIQAVWTMGALAVALAMRNGFRAAVAFAAVLTAFWTFQAILAASAARTAPPPRSGRALRVLGLIAFYAASTAMSAALGPVVKRHVVETFYVPAASMTPTVAVGDAVVVVRSSRLERGAVVVHAAPPGSASAEPLLKRVVALSGDTVEVRDGQLVLNGVPAPRRRVDEPCTYERLTGDGTWSKDPCVELVEGAPERAYRTHCTPLMACGDFAPVQVPSGHVFVLGDHRDHSADSRIYGPIPEGSILGHVKYVYFSFGPHGVRWDRLGQSIR